MNQNSSCLHQAETYFQALQSAICESLELLDGDRKFVQDTWVHKEGGGGVSRILENGKVFEKAGVNFSSITGDRLPVAATQHRSELSDSPFTATGVSVVCHPENPYVPTVHMNVRYIQVGNQHWWFGGGFDLTPYYGFEEDAVHWHQIAHDACDGFGERLYETLKQACDNYFYLKHRQEPRGIGGLFFDNYTTGGFIQSFQFVQSVGRQFLKGYVPIVERRVATPYTQREREFQLYRRGRYVEFNLVYDRGTLFGLQSGGRTESILMSLPPKVVWNYNWTPQKDTPEHQLYEVFLQPRDWLNAS